MTAKAGKEAVVPSSMSASYPGLQNGDWQRQEGQRILGKRILGSLISSPLGSPLDDAPHILASGTRFNTAQLPLQLCSC